ncbi:MAG: hypothetical protein H6591_14210 [Flavobacteriales bacterium]|nr:hypothetical protein [Flavobacteriales bacterium]
MRTVSVIVFGLVLWGSAAYHVHLKPIPQIVPIVLAVITLSASLFYRRAFTPLCGLLFAWALFGSLHEGAVAIKHLLFPPQPLPPGRYPTGGDFSRWDMIMRWPNSLCFLVTPAILWLYFSKAQRSRSLDLVFVGALLITWTVMFVLHEL